jgi:hypothetical protein
MSTIAPEENEMKNRLVLYKNPFYCQENIGFGLFCNEPLVICRDSGRLYSVQITALLSLNPHPLRREDATRCRRAQRRRRPANTLSNRLAHVRFFM